MLLSKSFYSIYVYLFVGLQMHVYVCINIQCISVESKAQFLQLILSCHYVSFKDHMPVIVVRTKYLYPLSSLGIPNL